MSVKGKSRPVIIDIVNSMCFVSSLKDFAGRQSIQMNGEGK